MGGRAGEGTHGNCRGPPVPSTSPRQGFVLRHLTVRSGTWSRRILEPRGGSRSSPLVIESARAPRRFRAPASRPLAGVQVEFSFTDDFTPGVEAPLGEVEPAVRGREEAGGAAGGVLGV